MPMCFSKLLATRLDDRMLWWHTNMLIRVSNNSAVTLRLHLVYRLMKLALAMRVLLFAVLVAIPALAAGADASIPTSVLDTRPAQLRLTYEPVDTQHPRPWAWAASVIW